MREERAPLISKLRDDRRQKDVLAHRPDLAFIMTGTNVHPLPEGHRFIADRILEFLQTDH